MLSLSQIQSGGGLLIVNPHGADHHQQTQQPPHPGQQMNGLTPLPPSSVTPDVNGHLLHGAASSRSDTSSNSPLDTNAMTSVGATSPVGSAVRSLTNLSDFSLDVSNGNYDNYGGITDSLLSAEASKEAKDGSSPSHRSAPHQQPQGPLLDFKSAFSDLDSKPSDLRYKDLSSSITV